MVSMTGGTTSASAYRTIVDNLQKEVTKSLFDNSKKAELIRTFKDGELASKVATVAAGILGVVLAGVAIGLIPVTFGFSSLLLVPAAALLVAAFDCYKCVRCCKIINKELEQRSQRPMTLAADITKQILSMKPQWAVDFENELNSTIVMHHVLNRIEVRP